jgi:hypothetical protein
MISKPLQDFVKLAAETKRITFGDVKRLRRAILPEGLIDRAEVEALLDLDATVSRSDAAWTEWLVASVVDYAVWGERPTGYVESEGASWLLGLLTRHGMSTKASRLIAREVAREAQAVDEAIEGISENEIAGEGVTEEIAVEIGVAKELPPVIAAVSLEAQPRQATA